MLTLFLTQFKAVQIYVKTNQHPYIHFAMCAHSVRVRLQSSGITPSYCECVLLSSRGRGLTKSTFSSSEGCKCAENVRNSSADSTRVQYRHSQRHLYYSQTGSPYNTTHSQICIATWKSTLQSRPHRRLNVNIEKHTLNGLI